jgi:hypothetical protein
MGIVYWPRQLCYIQLAFLTPFNKAIDSCKFHFIFGNLYKASDFHRIKPNYSA